MKKKSIIALLAFIWTKVSTKRRIQLLLLLILMFFTTISEVISIGAIIPFLAYIANPDQISDYPIVQQVLKSLALENSNDQLLILTIFFGVTVIVSGFMRICMLWGQTRLCYGIGADISVDIYRRTLYQPYPVHLERNSSEVISGIATKANGIANSILLALASIFSSILMLAAISITLFAIDPATITFAFLGFGITYAIAIALTKSTLMQESMRISKEQSRLIQLLQEGLGGIRDILIDGTQEKHCVEYASTDLNLRQAMGNVHIIGASPRYVIEAVGMFLIALLAYLIAHENRDVGKFLPILGALALGMQRILPLFQAAYSGVTSIQGSQQILFDVVKLLNQPLPEYITNTKGRAINFNNAIELRNISFRYNLASNFALENISLHIPKGARVGFIGTTGSGKSSLLDIVMGLLTATEGKILVDDFPVTKKNAHEWQKHIAHVPQSIFLADGTVAENIAFGIPSDLIDINQVRIAAEKAQISDLIESWVDGYQTFIGERGVRISGGQRQRLGLARAFYKRADVIILDEATSALDGLTESLVMKEITENNKDNTILMVAHRLSTLKSCNLIVELGGGKIVRSGTFAEIVT